MSIKSHAFGGVVLTDADAKKFKAQVTYGRPKAAAHRSVASGISLVRQLQKDGVVRFKAKPAK